MFIPFLFKKKVIKLVPYITNKIYIQNFFSIIGVNSLDIDENDWILDLVTASGGKRVTFSEKANKVSSVSWIKINFKEHGVKNIRTYNKDGRFVYKATGEMFDKFS